MIAPSPRPAGLLRQSLLILIAVVVALADTSGASKVSPDAPASLAPLDVVTVPWLGNRALPHEVYPGGEIILQGVAVLGDDDTPASVVNATWDPGDGTGPRTIDASNALALELFHTYQGTPGQQFTATLTVTDVTGATESDTFLVVVKNKTLDVEINMAVDKGLWELHKQIVRVDSEGVETGYVGYGHFSIAPTPTAVLAMAVNHHVATGDGRLNPYVHDVNRMLRWIETSLEVQPTRAKLVGDPDTNGNGITVLSRLGQTNRVTGPVMAAFIASEQPDRLAVLGPTNVRGRTYRELVQDMVDWAAVSQTDAPASYDRGRWIENFFMPPSQTRGYALNSIGQWVASGLIAAERVWGLTIPNFVKTENDLGVTTTWNPDGRFGEFEREPYTWEGEDTTPAGVIQWTFNGRFVSDTRLRLSLNWMAWYHRTRNNYQFESPSGQGNDLVVLHATASAYRLLRTADGQPAHYSLVDDDPGDGVPAWDWFRNDPPVGAPAAAGPVGVARAVLSTQNQQGQFQSRGGYYDYRGISQPGALLALSSTVFERGPRAVCSATPAVTSGPVTFNAGDSFHPVDGRAIVNYAWTFGDGASGSGAQVFHTYVVPDTMPATRTATLTVRDDRGNTHTTSCVVALDNSNTPPTATDNSYTTAEDTDVRGNVLTDGVADSDADGDPLSASVATHPGHGTLVLNEDGSFTYTPHADFHGSDSFTYQVADGRGGWAAATVSLTVTPVNDAPVAVHSGFTLNEDTPLTGNVLAGATDVDGDTLTAGLVTGPTHGTLRLNADGSFEYTPNADYNGSDNFAFVARDGQVSGAATITLTITPINDPPTLDPIAATTVVSGSAAHITLTGLTPGPADESSQTVSVTAVSSVPAVTGTISYESGALRFTPPERTSSAMAVVTVTATDSSGGAMSRTVTVTVIPAANTLPGAGVQVAAAGPTTSSPVSVTFSTVTTPGQTTYVTQQNLFAPPDGFRFGTPPVTFDISTTATYTAPLRVCIDYATVAAYANQAMLRLFHYENGRWVDRTASVDTAAQRVCATVTSLSPFALAEPAPIAGRMHGAGGVEDGGRDYRFEFRIDERRIGHERGRLDLDIAAPKSGKKQSTRDRFESTAIHAIDFWNDAAFIPGRGRRAAPQADSAAFRGTGTWNGQRGYTFDAFVTDLGEPGRGRDRLRITIRNGQGVAVATVDAPISRGNIESERLRSEHWR
jgi:VCBS repeat-containing protein